VTVHSALGATSRIEEATPAPPTLGWLIMWRVEVLKLLAQLKVRVALVACVVVPLVFVLFESSQTSAPGDTLFGQWIHESGFADALFLLAFLSAWGIPFLVSIVAGDVCAEEDRRRTWSLLLTRSQSRADVLIGKILATGTYTVAAVLLLGLSSTFSGIIVVGTQPLVSLSGALLSPGAAFHAALLSWLTVLPPALMVGALAVLVSVASRNTWVGVAAPVVIMFAIGFIGQLSAVDPIRPLLPTTGFDAWHGLVRDSVYTNQVWTAVVVSLLWIGACLALAAWIFLRRDVVDA
jgi:ABC-2 type transport system permease protein